MRGLGSGHVTCGPMRGLEKKFMGRGQTNRQTDKQTNGHRDSLTELAQWANSVNGLTTSLKNCETKSTHILLQDVLVKIYMINSRRKKSGGNITSNMFIVCRGDRG